MSTALSVCPHCGLSFPLNSMKAHIAVSHNPAETRSTGTSETRRSGRAGSNASAASGFASFTMKPSPAPTRPSATNRYPTESWSDVSGEFIRPRQLHSDSDSSATETEQYATYSDRHSPTSNHAADAPEKAGNPKRLPIQRRSVSGRSDSNSSEAVGVAMTESVPMSARANNDTPGEVIDSARFVARRPYSNGTIHNAQPSPTATESTTYMPTANSSIPDPPQWIPDSRPEDPIPYARRNERGYRQQMHNDVPQQSPAEDTSARPSARTHDTRESESGAIDVRAVLSSRAESGNNTQRRNLYTSNESVPRPCDPPVPTGTLKPSAKGVDVKLRSPTERSESLDTYIDTQSSVTNDLRNDALQSARQESSTADEDDATQSPTANETTWYDEGAEDEEEEEEYPLATKAASHHTVPFPSSAVPSPDYKLLKGDRVERSYSPPPTPIYTNQLPREADINKNAPERTLTYVQPPHPRPKPAVHSNPAGNGPQANGAVRQRQLSVGIPSPDLIREQMEELERRVDHDMRVMRSQLVDCQRDNAHLRAELQTLSGLVAASLKSAEVSHLAVKDVKNDAYAVMEEHSKRICDLDEKMQYLESAANTPMRQLQLGSAQGEGRKSRSVGSEGADAAGRFGGPRYQDSNALSSQQYQSVSMPFHATHRTPLASIQMATPNHRESPGQWRSHVHSANATPNQPQWRSSMGGRGQASQGNSNGATPGFPFFNSSKIYCLPPPERQQVPNVGVFGKGSRGADGFSRPANVEQASRNTANFIAQVMRNPVSSKQPAHFTSPLAAKVQNHQSGTPIVFSTNQPSRLASPPPQAPLFKSPPNYRTRGF